MPQSDSSRKRLFDMVHSFNVYSIRSRPYRTACSNFKTVLLPRRPGGLRSRHAMIRCYGEVDAALCSPLRSALQPYRTGMNRRSSIYAAALNGLQCPFPGNFSPLFPGNALLLSTGPTYPAYSRYIAQRIAIAIQRQPQPQPQPAHCFASITSCHRRLKPQPA